MKKGFTVILLSVFLLYRITFPTSVVHAEEVEISAPSGILMEMSTGTVLFEKDADTARPPASVTKIMTMLLIFDALENGTISLDEEVSTSEYAASMGGSQVFLEPGEMQTVGTLLKCISIASANDACVTMSECICGNEQEFVKQMNARAKGLGMKHTNFVNCNGLDADGHEMSARDIALMSRELMTKYPQIKDYCTVWMENITHVTRQGTKEFGLANTNKLLKMAADFQVTGLKTGSTSKAKYCLSATASRDNIDLIAVVMGSSNNKVRFQDAMSLLTYGYSISSLYEDKNEEQLPHLTVNGGVEDTVALAYQGPFRYLDTEGQVLSGIEKKIVLPESVEAPVQEGEAVGEAVYLLNGNRIGSVSIVTGQTVDKAVYKDYLQKVWRMFYTV